MHYKIEHTTFYTYSQVVDLAPHLVRLRPRSDAFQTLREFSLEVSPAPTGQSVIADLEGNDIVKLWFLNPTAELKITASSEVETHCINPFNYLLEPWATELPIYDYPAPMLAQLQPYLSPAIDPVMIQLAQEVWQSTNGEVISFLMTLNQRIYQTCRSTIRETGAPLPPGITWAKQVGSCRDLAMVLIEACRAMGLAARFVSGYQEGDISQADRHLHAWVEVYLPGSGWRGYDPMAGLAVADRHIALTASPVPRHAAPITGGFKGKMEGVQSQMRYTLFIEHLNPR
ncbi:MAG: transglutaminase family protein [Microcoleaceae cyanobacterium]